MESGRSTRADYPQPRNGQEAVPLGLDKDDRLRRVGMGHLGCSHCINSERKEIPDCSQFLWRIAGNKWQEGGRFREEEWNGSGHETPVSCYP